MWNIYKSKFFILIIILAVVFQLTGCATAYKSEDGRKMVITSPFGADAEFQDGGKISSKGLVELPDRIQVGD